MDSRAKGVGRSQLGRRFLASLLGVNMNELWQFLAPLMIAIGLMACGFGAFLLAANVHDYLSMRRDRKKFERLQATWKGCARMRVNVRVSE